MGHHSQQWFIDRIGHRIYRDWYQCCPNCDTVAKEGLVIWSEDHAKYLYSCQCEMPVNYRDNKKTYEKTSNNPNHRRAKTN